MKGGGPEIIYVPGFRPRPGHKFDFRKKFLDEIALFLNFIICTADENI